MNERVYSMGGWTSSAVDESVATDLSLHTGGLGGANTTAPVTTAVIARIQANPVARAAA